MEAGSFTLEGEREWLARVSAPDSGTRNWAIEIKNRHIGNCGLHLKASQPTAGLGIIIGDKTAWGKGYGTAAVREVLRKGFEEMDLRRIFLETFSANTRAIRCYERCGFRHEGLLRQAYLKRGRWHDIVRMAILREEWEVQKRGLTPEQILVRPERIKEWQDCMNALSPQPSETILDAGCGDGKRTLLIASCVVPEGRAMGFDISEEAVAKALRNITEKGMETVASAQCGDIRCLPLSDNSADAWFCRQTLEYLDNPSATLAEAARVVRPGGRVVAVEADWDTLIYNATDKEAERRFVRIHTDWGGGGSQDGHMGRKLLSLFRDAGLADIRLQVHPVWSDDYSPETEYLCHPLGSGVVRRGCISQEELDAWYADMSAQAEKGQYFHCFNYFICGGRIR